MILFSSLLLIECVGKPPEDNVALIKELLVKFERGLKEKNSTVLDSLIIKKQKNLSSELITDFSAWGEIKNVYIKDKKFTIILDSAKVALKLQIEALKNGKELQEFEKFVSLFLKKKKGNWRIEKYEIIATD